MSPAELPSPLSEQALLERWWEDRFRPGPSRPLPVAAGLSGATFAALCTISATLAPIEQDAATVLLAGALPLLASMLSRRVRQAAHALVSMPVTFVASTIAMPFAEAYRHHHGGIGPEAFVVGLVGGAYATLLTSTFLSRFERAAQAAPPSAALEASRQALAAPGGPDLTLLLFASEMPAGGRTLARIDLWRTPARGRVTAQYLPYASLQDRRSGSVELSTHEAERLLRRASVNELSRLANPAKHRLPCVLQVLRRDGPELHGALDLGALPEAERGQPTARLARAMLAAARRAVPEPGVPVLRRRVQLMARR